MCLTDLIKGESKEYNFLLQVHMIMANQIERDGKINKFIYSLFESGVEFYERKGRTDIKIFREYLNTYKSFTN